MKALAEDELKDLEAALKGMLNENQLKDVVADASGALCGLTDQATADRYFKGDANHAAITAAFDVIFH